MRFRQTDRVAWIGAVVAGALIGAAPAAADCGASTGEQCATVESEAGGAPATDPGTEAVPVAHPEGTADAPAAPVAEPVGPGAPAPSEQQAPVGGSYYEESADLAGEQVPYGGGSEVGTSPDFEAAQSDCDEYDQVGVDCPGLNPGGEPDPGTTGTGGDPSAAASTSSGGGEESALDGTSSDDTVDEGSTETDTADTASAATGGTLPSTGLGLGGPVLAGIALLAAGHALRRPLR